MNIKTKYEIGQHIWYVYENNGEACVFDDYIGWITYETELLYTLKESSQDLREEEVILYEESDKLVERIKQLMQEIREKEASKDE